MSGDAGRLQQVFWNLLSNAVKFTPRGGRVEVLLERIEAHVEVSILDTGEGISANFLPYAFDRFRQADASTTRRHGGLGLGLSLVRQLVELHGGTVRAESPGPGKGSKFVVALPTAGTRATTHDDTPQARGATAPADPAPLAPPNAATGGADGQELHAVRVLLVDDEADARALVKRLLEERGAVVVTASSAPEAVDLLQRDPPNVLVSDIGMPREDGYALIRRVRALGRDRGGEVPAVALTAYARSEDRVRVLQHGFQMHLAKPVEPEELVQVVATLAGRAVEASDVDVESNSNLKSQI